jgi:cell division septation protein DedD
MAWWNDFVAWFNSASGQRVLLSAILPFLAIIVAGLIAAAIGRATARSVVDHQVRELKGAAIIALIVVGRKASIWSSLGADEKQHVDSLMSEADIRVRLLPVSGATTAADWAAHQLADMKKNSASFSFQAEQTFVDYRDRLLDWQNKPGRAKKLFASDLSQWRYEDESPTTAPAQEWTPAPVTPSAVTPAPLAPTTTPTEVTEAIPTETTTTPGLATAPPPTVTAVSAPPPAGVTTP